MINRVVRHHHALFTTLALALLAGCATPSAAPPASVPTSLAADEGIVLLKVTALQRVSLMNAKWTSVRLKEINTGRTHTLTDQSSSGALHGLFSGALPAGQYRIDGMNADGATPLQWGVVVGLAINGMTSSNQSGRDAGSFTVVAGRLTNLGQVLNAVGEQAENVVVSDESALRANLDSLDAGSRAKVVSLPTASWDLAPDVLSAREAAQRLVRTRSSRVAFDFPVDGRVLIGAPLGEVHERTAAGAWRVHRTGSADTINAVRALPGGRIVAATDTGLLFVIFPDGGVAKATVPGQALVTAIEPMPTGGEVAILAQKFRSVGAGSFGPVPVENRVFIAADLARLEVAREMQPVPPAVQGDTSPELFHDGRSLMVWTNHSGFSRVGDVYRLNPMDFTVRKEEFAFWNRGMYRIGSNLLVRDRMSGLSIYSDFSTDDGRTWSLQETPLPSFGARFVDARNGWGLDKINTGWSTVTATLTRTSDGGKTWKPIGQPLKMAEAGLLRVSAGRVYIFTGRELMSTVDEGATWQREWPRSE